MFLLSDGRKLARVRVYSRNSNVIGSCFSTAFIAKINKSESEIGEEMKEPHGTSSILPNMCCNTAWCYILRYYPDITPTLRPTVRVGLEMPQKEVLDEMPLRLIPMSSAPAPDPAEESLGDLTASDSDESLVSTFSPYLTPGQRGARDQ